MREIKFRVWDKDRKKMVEPLLVPMGAGLMEFNKFFKVNNYIWMQYTGLNDKNRKEIYEGDILKVSDKGYIGIVHWHTDRYVIGKPMEGYLHPYSSDFSMTAFELEVIGNIYENPELVK